MAGPGEGSRLTNQERRTRKALLEAAARLLQRGLNPAMEEVAEEALVSRATAYRYFPNVEALLVEASIDNALPEPPALFAADAPADPVERVDRAEAAVHDMTFGNELQLRRVLVHAIQQVAKGGVPSVPVRQNRRMALIEAALEPARERLGRARYERLCAALALILGPESMIVFRDVLRVDAARAREVKSWAVRALVSAALAEAERDGAPPPPGVTPRRS